MTITSLPSFIFSSPTAPLPDRLAFVDCKNPDTHCFTLNGFREWPKRFTAGLLAAGLKPGDRVLLYSSNSIFTPVVVMGVILAGGIFTSTNPAFTQQELAYQLKDSSAQFLLAADLYI
jgi:4-coumarate--CoA ligase